MAGGTLKGLGTGTPLRPQSFEKLRVRDRDGEVRAYYEGGSFTVPASITSERVRDAFPQYVRKFGDALEKLGFTVLAVSTPEPDPYSDAFGTEGDRR